MARPSQFSTTLKQIPYRISSAAINWRGCGFQSELQANIIYLWLLAYTWVHYISWWSRTNCYRLRLRTVVYFTCQCRRRIFSPPFAWRGGWWASQQPHRTEIVLICFLSFFSTAVCLYASRFRAREPDTNLLLLLFLGFFRWWKFWGKNVNVVDDWGDKGGRAKKIEDAASCSRISGILIFSSPG